MERNNCCSTTLVGRCSGAGTGGAWGRAVPVLVPVPVLLVTLSSLDASSLDNVYFGWSDDDDDDDFDDDDTVDNW